MAFYIMQAVSSSNGQIYTWNSNTTDFAGAGYPGPGSPLNVAIASTNVSDRVNLPIAYHDLTHNPVGLWQFNASLNDSSGNAFNFTGTPVYTEMYPGVKGIRLINSFVALYNVAGTALQITGNMTIEMILSLSAFAGGASFGYIVSYGGNAATDATNILYSIANDTSGLPYWVHESTGPVTRTYNLTDRVIPLALCHFAVTRNSNVIQFYLNGTPFGSASSALTVAAGGTSSVLRVGYETGNNTAVGSLASLKIINSALTAAQIKAEYNRTLGPAFGVI